MIGNLSLIRRRIPELLSGRRLQGRIPVFWFLFLGCYYFSFLTRFRFAITEDLFRSFLMTAPIIVSLKCFLIAFIEKWRPLFPIEGIRSLDPAISGISFAAVILLLANLTLFPLFYCVVPKSVMLIDLCLCFGFQCLYRFILCDQTQETSNPPRWSQLLPFSLVLLGLCIGLVYGSLGYEGHLSVDWFNGDALFTTHVVDDVLVRGNSVSGWLFPPAPFVFPDIVFSIMSRGLSDNPAVQMFLTGSLLFLLIWISAYYGVATTTLDRKTAFLLVTTASAGVVLTLAFRTSATDLKYLFFPAYHTGTYGFAILLSVIGICLATTNPSRWYVYVVFVILGFCAGFSDLLTIAYVSAPLSAALLAGWVLNFVSFRRASLVSALIWFLPLVGVIAARFLLRMYDLSQFSERTIASAARGAEMMTLGLLLELKNRSPLFVMAFAWLLASAVWVGLTLYRMSRNALNPNDMPVMDKRRILLLLTFGLSGFSTIAALALGGNYTLLGDVFSKSVRYLHPLIFTPLFFWPLLIPESILRRLNRAFPRAVLGQLGVVLLLILFAGLVSIGKGPNRLHRYAPDYISALDRIAKERGLTQGVAYYWTARDVNLFSQSDLRMFSVNPDFTYFDWMNNRDWVSAPFDEHEVRPQPEFVILSPRETYSRETAVHFFGEPAEEIPLNDSAGEYSALIYYRGGKHQLSQRLLKPVLIWGDGFYDLERTGEEHWRWCESNGVATIENISGEMQSVRLEFECETTSPERATLRLESSFFATEFAVEIHRKRYSQIIHLPPGKHEIRFSSDAKPVAVAKDSRDLVFQIRNFDASVLLNTEL